MAKAFIGTSFGRRTLHKTKINTEDHSIRSSDPVQFILSSFGPFRPCKGRSYSRKRTLRVKWIDIACTRPYGFSFEFCRFFLFDY